MRLRLSSLAPKVTLLILVSGWLALTIACSRKEAPMTGLSGAIHVAVHQPNRSLSCDDVVFEIKLPQRVVREVSVQKRELRSPR